MTLSNLSIYVVFVDLTKALTMLCLSLPTTKDYGGAHRSGKTRKNILVIHML
jgi:hypothetical protein